MLEVFGRSAGFHFRNIEIGSCPPVDGDPRHFVEARREADCRASLEMVRPMIERYSVVIISSSWSAYQQRSATFLPAFVATVRRLVETGRQVILIGKVPEVSGYDRRCREKALSYPLLLCPDIVASPSREILAINDQLRRFAETVKGVAYFEVTPYLCPDGRCSTFDAEGVPKYFDQGHLTMEASVKLGRQIVAREGVPAQFARLVDTEPLRRHPENGM